MLLLQRVENTSNGLRQKVHWAPVGLCKLILTAFPAGRGSLWNVRIPPCRTVHDWLQFFLSKNQQTQLPPTKPTEQIRAHTLPLQLFCSHLIFFPFSATLVLLRIPAFSSRCPCRNADTQLSPQVTCFEMWLLCKHGSGEGLMKGLLSACLISSISLISAGNIFKYLKIFPGTKLKDLCDYSRTPKTFSADRGPPHGHKQGLKRPLCIPN